MKKRKVARSKKSVVKKTESKIKLLPEIAWMAPEWALHSKGIAWWTTFFVIFGGLLALSYYYEFWWGIIFIILLAAVILNHSFRKPREILCKIDDKGVKIGTRFFEWSELVSFWLVPNMPYTLLYLRSTNKILSVFSVEVPITKSETVFQLLAKKLALEDRREILADKFTRITRL